MHYQMNRRVFMGASASLLACDSGIARAATWPDRPVRLVVAFAPGGPVDLLARQLAVRLTDELGQSVIVENRAGAGGRIGTRYVAQAKNDGYTLLATSSAAHACAPALYPQEELGYDAVDGFTHIGMIGHGAVALMVRSDSRIRNIQELIAQTRQSGSPLHYGSGGIGSLGHLVGELTAQQLGISLQHIGYKGSAPAQTDLIGGQLPMLSDTLLPHLSHIQSGTLRALAVFTPARIPVLPNVPTLTELGWPALTASSWFAVSGSPNIPSPITERLNKALRKILAVEELQKTLQDQCITPEVQMTASEYSRFVAAEVSRWSEVVKAARIQVAA